MNVENQEVDTEEAKYLKNVLIEEIQTQVRVFDGRAKMHRRWFHFYQFGAAVASFLAAAALGLSLGQEWSTIATNAAFVLTLCAGLLKTFETIGNHRDLWIRYTATENSLKSLRRDTMLFQAQANLSKLRTVHSQFKGVLETSNERWEDIRTNREGE